MMHRNIDETEILKIMIGEGGCTIQDAMNAVHRGADPDAAGSNGNTLMHCLVKAKHYAQVKELVLIYRANVDIKNASGLTPLQCMINDGSNYNVDDAMSLVRLGADPNTKGSNGNTLLHCVVRVKGNAHINELVLKYRANIDIKNANGLTPLQCMFNNGSKYNVDDAMNLVRLGADPNAKGSNGNTLLHCVVRVKGYAQIKELVLKYRANIDIKNAAGLTPLQCMLNDGSNYNVDDAMNLVRLGADFNAKGSNGNTLLDYLVKGRREAQIKELNELQEKYSTKKYFESRNTFLNLLLFLVKEKENKSFHQECSYFKLLPIDIICYIVSFLDFESMGKTRQEGVSLTTAAFAQRQKIKEMFNAPGGINVFQSNNLAPLPPTFTFFKSTQTFCLDFLKFKSHLKHTQNHKYPLIDKVINKELTNTSARQLSEFSEKYAVAYWKEHSSLFINSANKQKLFNRIKDNEPYNHPEIQSQLKLK